MFGIDRSGQPTWIGASTPRRSILKQPVHRQHLLSDSLASVIPGFSTRILLDWAARVFGFMLLTGIELLTAIGQLNSGNAIPYAPTFWSHSLLAASSIWPPSTSFDLSWMDSLGLVVSVTGLS